MERDLLLPLQRGWGKVWAWSIAPLSVCPCVFRGGDGKAGEGQAPGGKGGGWSSAFHWPSSETRKGVMAEGLTAFSCLLLRPCLGDQRFLGPVKILHLVLWQIPRRTFQTLCGQEGLGRRASPVLTLYSFRLCCRLIALEMAKIHTIHTNGNLPKPTLWHKMHRYFTLVKDEINPRYRHLRGSRLPMTLPCPPLLAPGNS